MSQAGYTPISLYYSTTASAVPSSGNLVAGELALNTLDEKLYFKNSAGTVKLLASNAGSSATVSSVAVSGGTTGLTTSGGPITTSGTITLAGTLAIANGGTGQTTASAAFNALSPITTTGDLILGNGTNSATRLAIGANGYVLTSNGTTASWSAGGTVTAVSVASANGFAGTSSGGATPALTLSTSITGVLKGNGTALSAATAGTDYVAPGTATTFTATQTFSGSSSTFGTSLLDSNETVNVVGSAPSATTNLYVQSGSVQYYTSNAANNFVVNLAFSSGTSMNTALSTNQSVTAALVTTQSSTAYYATSVQVDGTTTGVTTKWIGGAPTAGNASGLDVYRFAVIKTASATYTVLASLTQFK